jgi:inosine-uridine nucleoside N-ribohydrolase
MNPIPIVIDTDMGPDDWMAILFLFQVPGVDIRAITVTGAGMAHLGFGATHALDLALLAGRPNTPVAFEWITPEIGDNVFPDSLRLQTDFFLGIPHQTSNRPLSRLSAADMLIDVIKRSKQKVTLVALGPLNNLAEAITCEPSIVDKIKMIYIMGGAINVPGNVPNSNAEWNIYIDPVAALQVFKSGAPITLVPLDATNQVPVTLDFYYTLGEQQTTHEAKFVFQTLTAKLDWIVTKRYFFFDPLAAAIAVDQRFVKFTTMHLNIITDKTPAKNYGRIVVDPKGPAIQVCTSVDTRHFENLFLNVLNGYRM